MRTVRCDHNKSRQVETWLDTARLVWEEIECLLCGRLWRHRTGEAR